MAMGRPSKIDQVVHHQADGTPITAGQQVINRVQLGMEYQGACDSAGIERSTLHRWRLEGARLRAQQAQGKLSDPTDHQLGLIDFCNALERAEAEAEANRLAIIQRAAQGGAVVTKTVRKVQRQQQPDGSFKDVEVERTEHSETLRPEWTAAAWWLERRKPARYARRVEVTGADGQPLVPANEQARSLADSLRDYLTGIEDATKTKVTKTKGSVNGKAT